MNCRNCGRGQMVAQAPAPNLPTAGAAAAPVMECDTCGQREANGLVVRAGRSIGLMRTSNPPGCSKR